MANPFKKISKNAEDTKSERDSESLKRISGVESRTCEQCGAPRPKDTNLTTCGYCGYKFMTVYTDIKSDN